MFEPKILLSDFKGMYVFQPPGHGQPLPLLHIQDKVNQQTRHLFASISNVIWILSSDTGTSTATLLEPGARKVLAKYSHFWGFNLAGNGKLALPRA